MSPKYKSDACMPIIMLSTETAFLSQMLRP